MVTTPPRPTTSSYSPALPAARATRRASRCSSSSSKAKGLTRRDYPTLDAQRASEVNFDKVSVGADALVGTADNGLGVARERGGPGDRRALRRGGRLHGSCHEGTLEYIKKRKQFGVPIGKFQVLQHRMVDMFINAEQARSMTYMATIKSATGRRAAPQGAPRRPRCRSARRARFVGQSAIQLHGGMGMTDEMAVGHYFKRLTMIDLTFGNQQHHLTRYSNLAMAA